MSLTSAFHNASSGLTVALRAASVTSSNLANVLTDGYAKRDLSVSARAIGGAFVGSTRRNVDQALLSDQRRANAEHSGLELEMKTHNRIERLIGSTEDPDGLSVLITNLETNLVSAITRPDQTVRITSVINAADNLAAKINKIGSDLKQMRQDADAELDQEVKLLNARLEETSKLNRLIAAAGPSEQAGLMDRRQAVIDKIARQVPIKTLDRGNGTVALLTPKGQFLLNDQPLPIEFSAHGMIAPGTQTLAQPTTLGSVLRLEGEGKIGALLTLRDEILPHAQSQFDALAEDLVVRTTTPGFSLFSIPDTGESAANLTLAPNLETTLSSSTTDTVVQNLSSTLQALQERHLTSYGTVDFAQHAAQLGSAMSVSAHLNEQSLVASASRRTALEELMARSGVDTDEEMQSLLRIEKHFAANAKALQTLENVYDTLLELG